MVYLLFFVTILGYTFVVNVSGLFCGALFYLMIFFLSILPLLSEEAKKHHKFPSKFNFKILLLISISAVIGMLFFSWFLQ